MRKIIIYLMIACSLCAQGSSSLDRWTLIRPSIFPILKGGSLLNRHEKNEKVVQMVRKAIQEAVLVLWKQNEPFLPNEIENIAILEEEEDFIIAFFRRGNGRVFLLKNEEVYYDYGVHKENPAVVIVNKKTMKAKVSDEYFAMGWLPMLSDGLKVSYPDATPQEVEEHESKPSGKGSRKTSGLEGVLPKWYEPER